MRIDGIISGQINLSNISDILSKLNVGDIVRAKVLDIMSDEMILKLFDGTTFTASNMAKIEASKGDIIELSVNAKNDNQLLLEVVKDKKEFSLKTDDLKKQLEVLKVNTEPLNLKVAQEVKKQGYPFNKDIIEKAADSILKLKDLDIKSAVFLSANNIDISENKVSALKQFLEGKAKIASDLTDLIETIKQTNDPEVLVKIQKRFQEVDNGKQNISRNIENKSSNTEVLKEGITTEASKLKDVGLKAVAHDSETAVKILNAMKSEKLVPEHIVDRITKLIDTAKQGTMSINSNMEKEFGELLDKIIFKIKNKAEETKASVAHKADTETKEIKDKIIESLEKFFVKVDRENLEKDINVKRLYKDLGEKLDIIKDSMLGSANGKDVSVILSKIDNMENNIRFCNDMSNFNSYYQIPLNIQNNNTTGQLFILKRDSKAKKINPENASMLISLDTENMGRVDSLVSLNQKNVSINVRVEAEELFEFIRQHSKELYNSLAEKGYRLVDLRYKLIEEPANILNAGSIARKEAEGRASIDYRI